MPASTSAIESLGDVDDAHHRLGGVCRGQQAQHTQTDQEAVRCGQRRSNGSVFNDEQLRPAEQTEGVAGGVGVDAQRLVLIIRAIE